MLSEDDIRLLRVLQNDPSLSSAELGDQLGISSNAAWRRVEKLMSAGVIKSQQAVIDWATLGYAFEVSLRVTLDKTQPRAFDDFIDGARDIPEVVEIQTFLGRVDVRLSVRAKDMHHYQELYRDQILTLPHIADIEALMQVASVKDDERLPL